MNLEGLVKKKNGSGTVYYENACGELVAKNCSKCNKTKALDSYASKKRGLGSRESFCKDCKAKKDSNWYEQNKNHKSEYNRVWKEQNPEYLRNWYEDNKERVSEKRREWVAQNKDHIIRYREKNKEKRREYERQWRKENTERNSLKKQRRRARKVSLPDTLTIEEYSVTLGYFSHSCALTGSSKNIDKEHAIPLAVGHGGTTFENCYPMASHLNKSKNDSNIFEWFEANRQRFELSQERFDNLIAWLASANAMTVEEYRDHVYWCHANPRNIDELEAQ